MFRITWNAPTYIWCLPCRASEANHDQRFGVNGSRVVIALKARCSFAAARECGRSTCTVLAAIFNAPSLCRQLDDLFSNGSTEMSQSAT
jgi:hypothetical protein